MIVKISRIASSTNGSNGSLNFDDVQISVVPEIPHPPDAPREVREAFGEVERTIIDHGFVNLPSITNGLPERRNSPIEPFLNRDHTPKK